MAELIIRINQFCTDHSFDIIFFAIIAVLIAYLLTHTPKEKEKKMDRAKIGHGHGMIFGLDPKNKNYEIFSDCVEEGHAGIFSATGTGKTSSIGIPTLRSWTGTSFVIDISGDLCKNCLDIKNKLIYEPENMNTTPYDIFWVIDQLPNEALKNQAIEELCYLLKPAENSGNAAAKYYQDGGRKILIAAFIAYYHQGIDFDDICTLIKRSSYQDLFNAIDASGNQTAIYYINGFQDVSENNIGGCKESADDAITLFATNTYVRQSLRRSNDAINPAKIETDHIFVALDDASTDVLQPLLNIITSQMMQYISRRVVNTNSPRILLYLDEYASLKLDSTMILSALRKYRKRLCRIMILTQNTADLDLLYGHDTTRVIMGNLKYKCLLGGLNEPDSQEYFGKLLGYNKAQTRSKSKNSRQVTVTEGEQREYIIEPADLDRQGDDTVILIVQGIKKPIFLKKNYYFKK